MAGPASTNAEPQYVFKLDRAAVLAAAGGFIVFALLAYGSIELTRSGGRIAALWLPNAIAVAVLLRFRVGNEPLFYAAVWAGNACANLIIGDSLTTIVLLATANITEIAIAVHLSRRWCGSVPDMEDIGDLTRFVVAAGIVAPTVSGSVSFIAFILNGNASFGAFAGWVTSDALSMLILAPSLLIFIDACRKRRRPTRHEILDWGILTIGGTTLTVAVFSQSHLPLLYLIPPVVVAHAFRLGSLGTAFSTLKVAVIALTFSQLNLGPLAIVEYSLRTKLILLQSFLATAILVGLPVAAMLATRAKIAHEAAEGRKQLALLADNITDAILRYDIHGVCTYASPSVRSVLGTDPETFLGASPTERMHPEAREQIAGVEKRLISGQSESERFTYRRFTDDENGKPVYIEADCALARNPDTGEREGIVVSARDVTDRVELERKLKRATVHAENAARAKSQFLANMSHEIRTPMNGVIGFADLLQRMPLTAEAARYADLISQSGKSMMMLLNDILDISKIESGQLLIQSERFDLPRLIEDCATLHRTRAEQKGIAIRVSCDPDLPRFAVSDSLRLRQILLNLIGNAVKFTEAGEIAIQVMKEGDKIAISVEDTGIGIAQDRLENIFMPFVQEEGSTTRRFGGTGLGLSISRQLTELLGGTLTVDSMPGIGSRFGLRFPLHEAAAEEPASQAKPVDGDAEHALCETPSRVLLAEDHDVNRMLVSAMLEECGQTVTLAHDGTAAIEAVLMAHECEEPFDLVLMDIQMPGRDGYSAARAIRDQGITASELPIIALTANAFPEDVAAAHDAGMQAHLPKPLVLADLQEVLKRWLPVRIAEQGSSLPSAPQPSQGADKAEDLKSRWEMRRREALDAVSDALRSDALEGVRVEDLARTVHKLAGTAGMFGEELLGERAGALERALRASVSTDVRRKLAQDLLEAA